MTSRTIGFCIAGLALLLVGCGGGRDSSGEFYTNWDIAGGCASDAGGDTRVNALGEPVDVCAAVDPDGWVWVTYAANWCSSSRSQAPQVQRFSRDTHYPVELFTVLTSSNEPFTPAQISDARAWASAHGLPPQRVLAEESTRVIPQHLLLGPDGRTWYRYIGHLDSEAMGGLLNDFITGERWPDVREIRR